MQLAEKAAKAGMDPIEYFTRRATVHHVFDHMLELTATLW